MALSTHPGTRSSSFTTHSSTSSSTTSPKQPPADTSRLHNAVHRVKALFSRSAHDTLPFAPAAPPILTSPKVTVGGHYVPDIQIRPPTPTAESGSFMDSAYPSTKTLSIEDIPGVRVLPETMPKGLRRRKSTSFDPAFLRPPARRRTRLTSVSGPPSALAATTAAATPASLAASASGHPPSTTGAFPSGITTIIPLAILQGPNGPIKRKTFRFSEDTSDWH